ncbi:hypothetical protein NDU88_001927 [Pleurodeles waltl]|uniref:Uncharacterized protein n=1 Tax=Pleurodeles waltl TaxID=8319 RepID=A0AAV7Q592_PLEWA|nr:hypothetical protein NDU88_001927 [Pleurodeles waltl]
MAHAKCGRCSFCDSVQRVYNAPLGARGAASLLASVHVYGWRPVCVIQIECMYLNVLKLLAGANALVTEYARGR